jgi:hypothetical protein
MNEIESLLLDRAERELRVVVERMKQRTLKGTALAQMKQLEEALSAVECVRLM